MRKPAKQVIRLACLLAALLPPATAASAACDPTRQAQVPVRIIAGVPVVDVQINNATLPFVLDTGAQRSLVTEATVQRAALRLDDWAETTVKGISGYERHRNADPASLALAGIALRRHTLAADSTLTVGPLPQSTLAAHQVAGLLGADFLAAFDLDLDLPAGRLALYRVTNCTAQSLAQSLPWPTGHESLGAGAPIRDLLTFPVELDGTTLRTEIDTGSSIALLTTSGIDRMGLTADLLANDPTGAVSGVGRFAVPMQRHHFATLQIGSQRIHTPAIWAARVHILPIVDLLLGGDWLRTRRVWFSYATSQIFVATGG